MDAKRWVVCIVAALSLIGIFQVAEGARPVCVHIEGIVTSGEDLFDDLGFGAGDGVLDGKVVEVTLHYNPALPPPNTSSNPLVGLYSSLNRFCYCQSWCEGRADFPAFRDCPL